MVRSGPLRPSFRGPASSRQGKRLRVRVGPSGSPPADTINIGWEESWERAGGSAMGVCGGGGMCGGRVCVWGGEGRGRWYVFVCVSG